MRLSACPLYSFRIRLLPQPHGATDVSEGGIVTVTSQLVLPRYLEQSRLEGLPDLSGWLTC